METLMTNNEFKAWLCGYVLLASDTPLTEQQITIIKNHAQLVVEVDGFLVQEHQTLILQLRSGQQLGSYLH